MRATASILLLALALWLATIAAVGTAAMAAFASLPKMGIQIESVRPFFGADTAEMGRYAAGHMLQPVFQAGDWVQYALAAASVSCTLRLLRAGGASGAPRWAGALLLALVAAAAALLAWRAWSMPAMQADLARYWSAVEANDPATATAAKASFDAAHRTAEAGYNAQLLLVLLAIPAALLAVMPARMRAPAPATAGGSAPVTGAFRAE